MTENTVSFENEQRGPFRERTGINQFHHRLTRVKLITGTWVTTPACFCCSDANAHHRRWQKRLSKLTTLRTHRIGN